MLANCNSTIAHHVWMSVILVLLHLMIHCMPSNGWVRPYAIPLKREQSLKISTGGLGSKAWTYFEPVNYDLILWNLIPWQSVQLYTFFSDWSLDKSGDNIVKLCVHWSGCLDLCHVYMLLFARKQGQPRSVITEYVSQIGQIKSKWSRVIQCSMK